MNTIEIRANISWEDNNNGRLNTRDLILCSGDYQPGNLDSMYSAINKIADDLETIKSIIDGRPTSNFRVRTRREDGTIIDEIDANYFENAKQVIQFMCIT